MSKIIGITGAMGAGKTYVANQIQRKLQNCLFLEVDVFRRKLLKENQEYRKQLESVLPLHGNWDGMNLNKLIYQNDNNMRKYKTILYEFLKDQVQNCTEEYVLVEWPMLVQDRLLSMLDGIIMVEANTEIRLKRVCGIDLSEEEILQRMSLQDFSTVEETLKNYQKENPRFWIWKISNEKEDEKNVV